MVPAAQIRERVLEPVLDAASLNGDQAADCDQIERTLTFIDKAVHDLHALVHQLAESNGVELERERQIAGFADHLTRDLADRERNGRNGGGAARFARSFKTTLDRGSKRDVFAVFEHTPATVLFSSTSLNELGRRRAARMRELHDEWKAARA